MTNDYVVGIDPGFDGGIAAIRLDGVTLNALPMPTQKSGKGRREIDAESLVFTLDRAGRPRLVAIEQVGAMPKQGLVSTFNFGKGFGVILGVLAALQIPYELVLPQTWKRAILTGSDHSKEAAIAYCRRRFPAVALEATTRSRKAHDGIAESLCLAEFARRLAQGEEAA